jgi:hypothetical protein
MIAPPEYKVEVVTLDKNPAIERLEKATAIIEKEIKERGGTFKLTTPPTRIGSKGDGVEAEDTLAKLDDNESGSGEESNESGMGGIELEEGFTIDEEEEKA